MKKCGSYEEAVEALLETPKFTTKNDPEATRAFYKALGCPGSKQHIIHTAGTNGKGSVCAYLESILSKAGHRTALFTSPHLTDIRERMRADGKMISKESFYAFYDRLCRKLEAYREHTSYEPTFFEVIFFMAMLWFEEEGCEFIILETGLGGRLDATNVIERPLVCIITSIGLDHMEYLGDTPEAIAGEKAGIIKRGVPLVCASTSEGVDAVLEERARKLGSKAIFLRPEMMGNIEFKENHIDFSLVCGYDEYTGLRINTIAAYQVQNASLAVLAARSLPEEFHVTPEAIRAGLLSMVWEGRMERIGKDLYLDGAHNIPGIRAFLRSVEKDGWKGGRSLVFGVVRDKAHADMIRDIAGSGLFTSYCITTVQGTRSLGSDVIADEFRGCGAEDVCAFDETADALTWAEREVSAGRRCYIAGSLYLVGQVKSIL